MESVFAVFSRAAALVRTLDVDAASVSDVVPASYVAAMAVGGFVQEARVEETVEIVVTA